MWDLSANFLLSEDDIGKNRAEACVLKLQELNNAVKVSSLTVPLVKEQLSDFQVITKSVLLLLYQLLSGSL